MKRVGPLGVAFLILAVVLQGCGAKSEPDRPAAETRF